MKRVNVKGNDFLVYTPDDIKIIKTGRYEDKEPNVFKMIAGFVFMAILMLISYMAYALIFK